ncbi:MAG: hypothetical protein ACHQT6_11580 [Candidatus Acidiferrales bacterium]
MTATLDLQHESLLYTASFANPPFELWGGAGGGIVKELYKALAPYKVTLQQFQLSSGMASAGDTVVTVRIGNTTLKFAFDKLEVTFASFSEEEFQGIPKFLTSVTGWLTRTSKDFRFSSHHVAYHSHSFLKGTAVDDFLRTLTSSHASLGGLNLGGGISLYRMVPDKKWLAELFVDKSRHLSGSLYIGLSLQIEGNTIDYESLLTDGREYLVGILALLDLELPSNP